jgi:hypothetical protein
MMLIGACVLLVSCGGGSGKSGCVQDFWNGTVGTCLPEDWDVIDTETLRQRGVPEETIVAFQSTESVSGQFPTVAVTRERLANVTKPHEYSQASMRSVEIMEQYDHLDTKDFKIDGQKIQLHIFTAQPIDGEPKRRFFQVSTTVGDTGFTVTAVTPVSINSALGKDIQLILENVTFVAPEEEE